ncbi:MAG: hypothetical protein HY898_31890 [Deltaproteobacteria bacterium]|nr:hypothetical protein [Deltaproteobacteria bacterium]
MRARRAVTLCVASALCAGAWSCNAVLGINDPEHAVDAGTLSDASIEETAAQPDGPLADTATEDTAVTDDHPDVQPETPPEAQVESGDETDAQPCGEPGQPCCNGTCGVGACCLDECVDTATDPANCGGCGTKCEIGCASSACVKALQVGLGDEHSCVTLSDKTVRCWGRGIDGELGNGAGQDQAKPQVVVETGTTALGNAVRVQGGFLSTCVQISAGSLRCFGSNSKGQLGDGLGVARKTADGGPTLTGVTEMSVGSQHVCAIASGSAWCWGYNNYRQVSPNAVSTVATPEMVALTGNVTKAACGYQHSCAARDDGTVWCWGWNSQGQLGNNSNADSPTPVQAQQCTPAGPLTGVQRIAAGARHTCAVKADKTVWCWGDGGYGQVGDGKKELHSCAVQTAGLNTAEQIAAGNNHTCAVLSNNALYCWGYNAEGEVGNGTKIDVLLPAQVLDNVVAVDLGDGHSCAARVDGSVDCWGINERGQLGDGTKTQSVTPKKVIW